MNPKDPPAAEGVFQVSLEKLVYGGDALGRLPDGRAVFVPFALPGEVVRLRLREEKKRFARAELVSVMQPAPGRIEPRCRHFATCGGCHYQHLPYPAQLEEKSALLRDQLERIGGFQEPPVGPTVPSPSPWNYRNHVQFSLTADGALGYHLAGSEQVFAVEECHLPEPPLEALRPLLELEAVPGLERVSLRAGAGDDLQVVLESEGEPPALEVDLPISVVHLGPGGPAVMAGSEVVVLEVLGRPFQVSAESFFQVNTAVAGAMVEHLLAHLSPTPAGPLLELYSGVGLFSAFLAPRVEALVAVEASAAACQDFVANLDEFENVSLYEAPAEEVLPSLDLSPGVVLVDPPRAGLTRAVLDGVVRLAPAVVAYVSCDPATLARDGRRLADAGYRLEDVTPFDLFPQTYHIESISFWLKNR